MSNIDKLKELYGQGKYREIIEHEADIDILAKEEDEATRIFAWAFHQLGEYKKSIPLMTILCKRNPPESEIGESARTGLAQGLLQQDGDIAAAEKIINQLPYSLKRDNVRMNMFSKAVDQKVGIDPVAVMTIVNKALDCPVKDWSITIGHIVNNAALVFFKAREQDEIMICWEENAVAFADKAIGIYEYVGAQRNHIAGALYRKALIHKAIFEEAKEKSVSIWEELVASQGGDRYQKNLEGAMSL
jgi:hypothetical protein